MPWINAFYLSAMASDLKIGMLMHVVWRCTRSCFPPRKRGFMLLIGNHPLICILQIMLENESYLKPPVLALYQSVPSQCPARVDLQMKGWPSLQVAFDWNYWSALLPYSDSDDSLVVYLPLWKIWKSVGIMIPNIWKNKSRVPNHQPVIIVIES